MNKHKNVHAMHNNAKTDATTQLTAQKVKVHITVLVHNLTHSILQQLDNIGYFFKDFS
jgi:hypothetical protein